MVSMSDREQLDWEQEIILLCPKCGHDNGEGSFECSKCRYTLMTNGEEAEIIRKAQP